MPPTSASEDLPRKHGILWLKKRPDPAHKRYGPDCGKSGAQAVWPECPGRSYVGFLQIPSACIVIYAVIVLFGALRAHYVDDMADPIGLSKAIVRSMAMSGIAFWILSTSKYSWWFAILSCGTIGIFGLVALGVFGLMPIESSEINYITLVQLIISSICLLAAFLILIKKNVRQLFK